MSKTTEEKILQVVNLSPDESIVEKLTDIHPMTQIAYASVLQVVVFGFMMLSFATINLFLNI
jgi:hypothetical protein